MKATDFIGIDRALVKKFLKQNKDALRRAGYRIYGLSEAQKASLYLEKVFNVSTRVGMKFYPGFEFVQIQDGDLPVRVEKRAGALIVAEGNYKSCLETQRDYIHKFRSGDRFFEISGVDERQDELKKRRWQECKAVLLKLPQEATMEKTARQFLPILLELQDSCGWIPKIYLYQDDEGVWLKAICYDAATQKDWELIVDTVRELLGIPAHEDMFTTAVLWLYKEEAQRFDRLPDSAVAVRQTYNLGLAQEGLTVCSVCGKAIPCIGFEASMGQYCHECQKTGHHVQQEAPRAPKSVCYPGDPERSFC